MDDRLTTGAVARLLEISEAVLQATLRRHPELAPRTVVAGRRWWTRGGRSPARGPARRA